MTEVIVGFKGERKRFAAANRFLSPTSKKHEMSFRMDPPKGGGMRNLLKL
jgi:hypothetical protein